MHGASVCSHCCGTPVRTREASVATSGRPRPELQSRCRRLHPWGLSAGPWPPRLLALLPLPVGNSLPPCLCCHVALSPDSVSPSTSFLFPRTPQIQEDLIPRSLTELHLQRFCVQIGVPFRGSGGQDLDIPFGETLSVHDEPPTSLCF